jgi:ketosteroid isomerase-like protein
MPLDLPGPIAEYFAAEQARDALALARCFVDDGVVHDEGGTFRGSTAIRVPESS